jgi:S1-C subfamily serine protease
VDSALVGGRLGRSSLSVGDFCRVRQTLVSTLQDAGAQAPNGLDARSCIDMPPAASRVPGTTEAVDAGLSIDLLEVAVSVPKDARCAARMTANWRVQSLADSTVAFSWTGGASSESFCASEVDGLVRVVRLGTNQFLRQPGVLHVLTVARDLADARRAAERSRRAEEEATRQQLLAEEELATWGRPIPPPTALVVIDSDLMDPGTASSVVARAGEAVVTLVLGDRLGSAFILGRDGLAVTNAHVVKGFDSKGAMPLRARFPSGEEVPARVLRVAETLDAALVQVLCESPCRTVPVDLTAEPQIGDDIYLLGSPHGLELSVSRGIVSSVRFAGGATLFQTDAAANPGNSGGPMIHAETGMAVGVLTFGIVNSEGLNFAIAIQDVMRALGVRVRQ